ncbi:MAG: hypothetical protein LC687_04265 [Actinobacteria bacterium]|nr:hypothetical protein [Actinomycetota bacterium]
MNSNSRYNFENFDYSATTDLPAFHHPKLITAERNMLLQNGNSVAARTFSPFPSVTSKSPLLNSSVTSTAPHPDRWVQAETEEALRKKLVVEETAKYFREKVPSPEFFGTLTFNKEVRKEPATKIFLEYLRRIAKTFGSHFRVAWGGGYQAYRSAYHTHFLASRIVNEAETVPPSVTTDDLMGLWNYGISEVEPYDLEKGSSDRGAHYYIADHEDTDVWVACTRTKRCKGPGGCKVERSIW